MAYSLSTKLGLEEITLNEHGDKIYISADDSALLDNYVKCFDSVLGQANESEKKIAEIEKKYEEKEDVESQILMAVEASRVYVEFSENAAKEIDNIFGDGTVRKYFRDHYEKIPSFLPGVDCFMDFFEQMSPVMEEVFGKTIKNRDEASKARMAKYKPQDHKRKSK